MSLNKFQRTQYICVKCICSRSLGNNSVEWLSATQKTHTSAQSGIPSAAIYGAIEGRWSGVSLAPGRGCLVVPGSPCYCHSCPSSSILEKICPGQGLTSCIFAQRKNNSFLLSLNHCNRLHRILPGKKKMSLWICEYARQHGKNRECFWCQEPGPIIS